MESLHKLEDVIGGWVKPLPHLPANWREWLAKNAWWLTLIGVILAAFGALSLLSAASLFGSTSGLYGSVIYTAVVQTHGGLWLTSIWVSLILSVITIIVEAMAISPLKKLSKKGWDLLFLAYLIGIVSGVISALLNIDIMALISTAIGAVIGAYVLFEVRTHFKKA